MQWAFEQLRTPLNGARPINRLPPEVLSTILQLATGPLKAPNLHDVLRLSSICRHWRATILGHGAMWSNIHLFGQDPDFVTQQVKRCRGVPLHLFIDLPYKVFRVEGAPFLANFKQIVPVIKAKRSQVRSISVVTGGCRVLRRDLGQDWPNLEELVWVDACPIGSRTHEQDFPAPGENRRPSKLRYLSAKQGLGWGITSITPLTTLKLEGPMNIDIFKLLQVTPHLESLELTKFNVQPPPRNAASFDLPRLTKLEMDNVEYGSLFARVIFPSLRSLSVNTVEHEEPVEIVWCKLQVPPAITAVKIEYLSHRYHKISITGSNEAKTHSLNLTEHFGLTRGIPMIMALSDTSLTSVTSLSIGKGVPEGGVQLPPTPLCILISGLPHLSRLDLFPSHFTVEALEYLCQHQLECPELKILSLTVARRTCEAVFELLWQLVTERANSERWLHRIDCVILRAGGDPRGTARVWGSMSQEYQFEEHLRCNCRGKVRKA